MTCYVGDDMRISNYNNEKSIIVELGNRIQQYRISLNITQAELSETCGISLKTITRIENGEDLKLSNLIKIMNVFGITENLDVLIPEPKPDYKAMFEEKTNRKRVRSKKKNDNNWIWGEDEEV